jgi:hypothetical protein
MKTVMNQRISESVSDLKANPLTPDLSPNGGEGTELIVRITNSK